MTTAANPSASPAESNNSSMGWRQRILQAEKLQAHSADLQQQRMGSVYDRIALLVGVFNDDEFRREIVKPAQRDYILSKPISEVGLDFASLRVVLGKFPRREQWLSGGLSEMYAEAERSERKIKADAAAAERAARKPQPKPIVKAEAAPQLQPAVKPPQPAAPEVGEACEVRIVSTNDSPAKSDYRPAGNTHQRKIESLVKVKDESLETLTNHFTEVIAEKDRIIDQLTRRLARRDERIADLERQLREARKGQPALAKA